MSLHLFQFRVEVGAIGSSPDSRARIGRCVKVDIEKADHIPSGGIRNGMHVPFSSDELTVVAQEIGEMLLLSTYRLAGFSGAAKSNHVE